MPKSFAFALRGRSGGADVEIHGDGSTTGSLRAAGGGSSRDYVCVDGSLCSEGQRKVGEVVIQTKLTEGSLFAGIMGFALGAKNAGIKSRWASEIDKFAIQVAQAHFPEVTQIGDVTKVDGAKIEPVDILTFGSPCQDLSVANAGREGLEGSRSALFFEAVRIIREMREETNGRYPRIAVWENVPGALSSHKGEDFRQVIESLVRVVEPQAVVPTPRSGRWANSGMVRGRGWSLAWRILDAQYFGVPQRRRRIFVVVDFGHERADEILLEREGVCGDSATGGKTQTDASPASRSGATCSADGRVSGTLLGSAAGLARAAGCASELDFLVPDTVNALTRGFGKGGADDNAAQAGWHKPTGDPLDTPAPGDKAACITTRTGGRYDADTETLEPTSPSGELPAVDCDCRNLRETSLSGTLQAKESGSYSLNYTNPVRVYNRVRRLTPRECERLQGFPDDWTAFGSDTSRYKACGNAVAVPVVTWIMRRISAYLAEVDNDADAA